VIAVRLGVLGCALAFGTAGTAAAADSAVTAVYVLSWTGMDVGELRAEVVEADGAYRAVWAGRTTGLIGTLFPFTSAGTARGRREGNQYLPDAYDGESHWRDGGGIWRVAFGSDGRATEIQLSQAELADREPVPAAMQVGPDPATLALMAIAAASPGARLEAASFDGKRAIGFELTCAPATAGGELSCSIETRLLAGASRRWRESQPQPDERPPVQVWLRPRTDAEGFWPARLEVPSPFGSVTARLTSLDRSSPADG
jgi:Protein of unknown function (DUF3108)